VAKRKRANVSKTTSGQTPSPIDNLPPGVTLRNTLDGHRNAVYSVAIDLQRGLLASGSRDSTVKLWETTSGRLLHTLEGHKDSVYSVAFDRSGDTLASGSIDGTVKLWEATSGRLLRTLEGETDAVYSVAFDRSGETLASGGRDTTVKLWEATSGKLLRTLKDHQSEILSAAFGLTGDTLASGSLDNRTKLWNVASGKLLRTLEGHEGEIWSITFDQTGETLASGSGDTTVKLWDATSGRLIRTLEGHKDRIQVVAFSPDGRLLTSKSDDQTIRLWSCETWETVAVIPTQSPYGWWIPALAFHPDPTLTRPLLATAGSPPDTPEYERSRQIHLWELDLDVLLGGGGTFQPAVRTVSHTTAKVVLVGDTGVGKSTIADRLVTGKFVSDQKSTHARRTLRLDMETVPVEPSVLATDAERARIAGAMECRETVLWDLAGQPAYRLVHQLSLDSAAVACVLFDARSETSPFEPAAYWARVLKQARTNAPLTKYLVASRVDVGGLPASLDRIEAFAREHGFDGFFQTSAATGEGCEELLARIRNAIPWSYLPAVSSSQVLADLREFMAKVSGVAEPNALASGATSTDAETKSKPAASAVGSVRELVTITELQQQFESESDHTLPRDEFNSYLQRLEDTGVVDVLTFHTSGDSPRGEDQVLLDPTRIDAYASAVLVQAKDEPDGPGHLLESRILAGDFKLPVSERLSDKDSEKHLLWYVMEKLFARDLALRETIEGQEYVVFPAQCTSPLTFPGGTAFGVAYGMAGPVRAIYATLIAQLAHFSGFEKREFFQDAAAYHTKQGHRSLIRFEDRGDGTGELLISFDKSLAPGVRAGFLDFVSKHIQAKANVDSFSTRHAYQCESCSHALEDRVVQKRLELKSKDLMCPVCESRTPLIDLLAEPNEAAQTVSNQIGEDAQAGRKRITAGWVIKGKEAQGHYDVFLSHNSKDKRHVEPIANALKKIGLRPWFDKWDLAPGDILVDKLEWAIEHVPCAMVCFGEHDGGKWQVMEYRAYLERWVKEDGRLIPVLLPGAADEPELPVFIRQAVWSDMRDWKSDPDAFSILVHGILGKAPGDSPMRKLTARQIHDWQQPQEDA
jgi:small GTP-binding protein